MSKSREPAIRGITRAVIFTPERKPQREPANSNTAKPAPIPAQFRDNAVAHLFGGVESLCEDWKLSEAARAVVQDFTMNFSEACTAMHARCGLEYVQRHEARFVKASPDFASNMMCAGAAGHVLALTSFLQALIDAENGPELLFFIDQLNALGLAAAQHLQQMSVAPIAKA